MNKNTPSLRVLAISSLYPTLTHEYAGIFIHRLHREFRRYNATVTVAQSRDWYPRLLSRVLPDRAWRDARSRSRLLLDDIDGVQVVHPVVSNPRPSRLFTRKTWFDRTVDAHERWVQRQPADAAPDVLLAHFAVMDGAIAVELGARLGLPVAVMTWGDDIHSWPEERAGWAALLTNVLSKADALIACSRQMTLDAERWGSAASDWSVVYAGVDLDTFRPLHGGERPSSLLPPGTGRDHNRRVLLCVARIEEAKGHRELLAAFRDLAGELPEWDLILAGPIGDGSIDAASMTTELDGRTRIFWIGAVCPQQLPLLYRSADAFVLASHREGLSVALLEALASALPVVSTEVGGHSEVVSEPAGILIPPNDTSRLRTAMSTLLSGRAKASPEGARKAAESVGSPALNAERLVGLLRGVAHRRVA